MEPLTGPISDETRASGGGDGREPAEVLPFAPRSEPAPSSNPSSQWPSHDEEGPPVNENVLPDVLPPDSELVRASFFGVCSSSSRPSPATSSPASSTGSPSRTALGRT